jgi:hypothetical protein
MHIRQHFPQEELDYPGLMSALSGYANPRDKIRNLLASGDLLRVKKGLYVFSEQLASRPYSKEVLANLIYGPSYISLDYALAFYGLIPERVDVVTSVTSKRDKIFDTAVGQFSYRYLHAQKYAVQMQWLPLGDQRHILMASPEKAVVDTLTLNKQLKLENAEQMSAYLFEDRRVPSQQFVNFKRARLLELQKVYQHPYVDYLAEVWSLQRRKGR